MLLISRLVYQQGYPTDFICGTSGTRSFTAVPLLPALGHFKSHWVGESRGGHKQALRGVHGEGERISGFLLWTQASPTWADPLVLRMAQRVTFQNDEVNFARTRIWLHS